MRRCCSSVNLKSRFGAGAFSVGLPDEVDVLSLEENGHQPIVRDFT